MTDSISVREFSEITGIKIGSVRSLITRGNLKTVSPSRAGVESKIEKYPVYKIALLVSAGISAAEAIKICPKFEFVDGYLRLRGK